MRLALAALVFVACAPSVRVSFDPPPGGSSRTEVLGVARGGELFVFVHALEDGRLEIPLEFAGGEVVRLEALLFDETPEALGLSPGLLMRAGANDPGARFLPPARVAYESEVTRDGASAWRISSGASLRDFMFAGDASTPCVSLEAHRFRLGDELYYSGLFALDRTSALLISHGSGVNRFFRITLEGAEELPPELPPDTEVMRGIQLADGRIFVFSDRGFVRAAGGAWSELPVRPPQTIAALAAPPPGSGDSAELYALAYDQTLHRYANGAWEQLGKFENQPGMYLFTWVAPGSVATTDGANVFVYANGTIRSDSFSPNAIISELATVPEVGVLAGLGTGEVYRRIEGGWMLFRDAVIEGHRVHSFARFGAGMMIGSDTGLLQQWDPTAGYCPPIQIGADTRIFDAVELEGGLLVAGDEQALPKNVIFAAGLIER